MLLEVYEDRMGNIYANPVSEKLNKSLRKQLKEIGMPVHEEDALIFLQEEMARYEFCEYLSQQAQKDISQGWTVKARISDEIVLAMIGLG